MVEELEGLEIHEVDEPRWPHLVQLFESRGGPGYCWCLLWRESGGVRTELDRAGKRAAMERRVRGDVPVGLLAYLEGHPVAWCSVAPRETYMRLGGDEYPEATSVWSVVCFFAQRPLRGRGITSALLRAAVDQAASAGADVVEAYPVDPDSPSYRFMGFRSTFVAAGFEEVRMVGTRRHLMRLRIPGCRAQ